MPKHWLAGFKAWLVLGVAMLVILGSCLPEKAHAMPLLSQEGCSVIADVALSSRALARNNVVKDAALPILTDVYDVSVHPYIGEIMDATYRENEQRTAKKYATDLLGHCLRYGGDLEKFFGTPL